MSEAAERTLQRMQSRPYRAWLLGLLLLVAMFGFADRQVIFALGQPIKRDLGLTDAQFGALGGFAFAVLNSLLAIPIARLADRGLRVRLISAGVFLWSIATCLCGVAQGFVQLVLARLMVGMGEATGAPATSSLIADYYPREKRASVMGIYTLAVPLGALIGAAGGGYIALHANWRTAFFIAGLPGVILGLLLFLTIREPLRGHYDPPASAGEAPPSLLAVLKRMVARPSFLHTALGSTLVSTGGFGILSFHPQYFARRFGLDTAQAGLLTGLISAIPGVICMLGAGYLADRLGRKDPRFYGWLPAAGGFLAAPIYVLAFMQSGWIAATTVLMINGLVQYAYLPVSVGVYQNVMEPRMRASATAVVGVLTNLVSASVGPFCVGALSDAFAHKALAMNTGLDFAVACAGKKAAQIAAEGVCGEASATGLQWACMAFALIYLWGAVHFMLAARTLKQDLA